MYCSPLRLLAWEISESLNKFGTKCDLVTGQELKRVENAEHIACTVEMVGREQSCRLRGYRRDTSYWG